jgi:chemotaxis protein CheZ
MLSTENGKSADTLFSDLKQSAEMLVQKLEEGDFKGATSMIELINAERDQSIYKEVGRLTRGIHDAIVNFHVDTSRYNLPSEDHSQIANARDRLDYVINLTQQAADTTMDMVEQGIPVTTSLGQESAQLRKDWGRLLRREMDPSEFRTVSTYRCISGADQSER